MVDVAAFVLLVIAIAGSLLALWRMLGGGPARRSTAAVRLGACAVAALLIAGYTSWRLSNARTVQLVGTIVPRVATTDSVVALTFDDGPAPGATEQVLQALEREGIAATFFLNGSAIEEHPARARRIVRAGHEVGNHSYSHSMLLGLPLHRIRSEIEQTDEQIRRAGYEAEIHFRSPYAKKFLALPIVLARGDRTNVLWDVEPESFPEVARSADRIAEHVFENVRPGSIVLLHVMFESRAESLAAVPEIIRGLHARGYRFVTVSELLGAGG